MTWHIAVAQPSELGESPFWHPAEQRLYWVDISARQICRTGSPPDAVERWTMPSEPGCIAPVCSAGLVIALRDGVYRARQWGGSLERLAPALHDPATSRFNDGKADPLGRFWAGTIYEPRDAALAQLFCLDGRAGHASGLEVKAANATTANGLAWSPDAATLYWADTPRHTIRAWDWDAARNSLRGERIFRQFPAKPAGWQAGMSGYGGRPDGAAVDATGNYYVAMYEGARLLKLSPAGEIVADYAVPAQCPTMPCFGGADLKTLFLTTARQGRAAAELLRWPASGCVLSMRVEAPGLPVNFCRL
ncbi:MAG: SMP-30/gluconolactonase/LRE family protein [Polaromonas sp.]|nr:SMP-30/gluconolactonase/LRE family protein [Polaromonas sp.]